MNKKFIYIITMLLFTFVNTLSANHLSNIISNKKIVVGVIGGNKPFIFKNRMGKIVGFEIDLINEIAKDINVKIILKNMKKNRIIKDINSGKVDLVLGSIIHTNKLDKEVDFSITYFYNGQAIMGKKSLTSYNIDSLINKSIGVIENSLNFKVLEVIQPLAKLSKYKSFKTMIEDLSSGKIDAIGSNYGHLLNISKSQNNDFKMIGNPYTIEPYGILMKENDSNFRDRINLAIENIVKNGEYNNIYKKWFKKNPIKNITLWP